MSRGIALQLRRRFGQIQQLRQQEKSLEDVIFLCVEERIFYLITKLHSWQKPTYQSIFNCLQRLKLLCEKKQITKLACPRIGCGLDGLKWEEIRKMLRYIFKNTTIYVSVYTKEELSEDEKLRLISKLHDTPLGVHQGVTRTFNRIYAQCH
ncbi:ADP-ribose glycohydrolase OARD1-like [Metopolophium dirhodum]|uniref:ADP-ribose glycohydrolase OARD1-like n=1 Tax=Metopolophium dirhodum TaxID=44670 RepID=UPI0029906A4D|nr:ADP-ribose glycohydrolase OARD1-like [Metopolophium dirhodum]